ncbi:MAG: HPr kinase/phosphatase C-terminal domain-containing protein [Gammaproteobacteria bacterium]|nr:HPr kinase/phosphatase C-terminal domain-containing protein [Gammaproteobacteria bacterium]
MRINHHGVLILGEAGIGKSELCLKLLARGHQLVADDSVTLHKKNQKLFGHAPEKLAGLLQIRELGLINIKKQFGANALTRQCPIHAVVVLIHPGQIITDNPLQPHKKKHHFLDLEFDAYLLPIRSNRPFELWLEIIANQFDCNNEQAIKRLLNKGDHHDRTTHHYN